jgi:GTPase involved in cell partitioning and DNA repair
LQRTGCCCIWWIWRRSTRADPAKDAKAILKELKKYDEALYKKPRWLLINKIDLVPEDEREARIAALVKSYKPKKHFVISAISREGCREVTLRRDGSPGTADRKHETADS